VTEVSNPYLSQIERGLSEPSARVLRSIAQAGFVRASTRPDSRHWGAVVRDAEVGRTRAASLRSYHWRELA
jgi:transcriptional regulator with XRE-family HTH domain